jgi:hypothetical protein
MIPKNSLRNFSTIWIASVMAFLLALGVFIFTNRIIYGIIFTTAAVLAILGFVLMIRLFDRSMRSGKVLLPVVISMGKLVSAGIALVVLSHHSILAVLCFAAGFLVVAGAVMVEGIIRLITGFSDGRT